MMRPHRWGGPVVGPLCRRLSIIIVSIVSVVCSIVSESSERMPVPKGKGLLTVINHQSVVDVPLDRFCSLDQPTLQLFHEKLKWGVVLSVFREQGHAELELFNYGVGKIISHSYPNVPIVLPMYHKGMDQVIPEEVLDDGRVASAQRPITLSLSAL